MALICFVDVHIEVYVCCEWWSQDKKLGRLGQEQQRFSSTPTHPVNLQPLRGPISHSVADVKEIMSSHPKGKQTWLWCVKGKGSPGAAPTVGVS